MQIRIVKIRDGAVIPKYATAHSAGCDLVACIEENKVLAPQEIAVIKTGISIEIPNRFFGMVCSRSGLSVKHGVIVLNAPGVIDSDYRGEIGCIMMNQSTMPFTIEPGMRIAQLLIMPYQTATFEEASTLNDTSRGNRGFGSTGI
ncbi:MAG: dUTP diphosphatase [Holosporales bacterium]|jgi:dUTP pyrophosphatase|nr:dUTP diphosphatase [Holosporales bacterium]